MKMFKLKEEAKRKECKRSSANYETQIRAIGKDASYKTSSKTEYNQIKDIKSMQLSK